MISVFKMTRRFVGPLAVAAALGVAAPAWSDDASVDDLQSRLERLEQNLKRLEQENQTLREASAVDVPEAPTPPAKANADQIKDIVRDTLKEEKKKDADLKKADEDKKKKDDDAAKKKLEAAGYEVATDLNFKTFWKDGMQAETANKDFRVHVGGRFQSDVAWFSPSKGLSNAFPANWQDGADFRRLRFRVDGTAWEVMDFFVEVEFSQGVQGGTQHPFPTDVFLDFKYIPFFGNIAAGHYKEPFSLQDYATPDNFGVFMERAVDDAFSPDRNLGIMWHNAYFEDNIAVASGIFRSNSDQRSGNVFDYGDAGWAYTSRVVAMPYYECDGRCWLMFGPAFSHRVMSPKDIGLNGINPSQARFQLREPIRVGSPNLLDTGFIMCDNFQEFNFQAALNLGSTLIQGECYYAQVHNARRGLLAPGVNRLLNPGIRGWYVQASRFLTGEYHPLDRKWGRLQRVRPNENWCMLWNGDKGSRRGLYYGPGACEIAARYSYCDMNSNAFNFYPGVPGVAGSSAPAITTVGYLQDVTLCFNCYMNPQVRAEVNYVHAFRGVGNPNFTGDVDTLGCRLWLDF